MAMNTTTANNTMCTLRTKDGDLIVSINAAKESSTIKGMLDCYGDDNGTEGNIIPLNTIKLETVKKLVDYCNYVTENKHAVEHIKKWINDYEWRYQLEDAWLVEYLNVSKETAIELINAANFLDIEYLLKMLCKYIASMMKGKNPDELYEFFGKERPQAAASVAPVVAAAASEVPVVAAAEEPVRPSAADLAFAAAVDAAYSDFESESDVDVDVEYNSS